MLFQQFVDDDLGCASYLVGDETRASPQSSTRRTRSSRCWPRQTGAASGSCERSRRARTPTISQGTDGSPSSTTSRSRSTRLPRRSTSTTCSWTAPDRARSGRAAGDPYARAPAGAHLHRRDRPLAGRGAADLSSPATRSSSATPPAPTSRPRRRRLEGLFHSPRLLLELGDGVEVFPGHVAGSLYTQGDELEGVLDDRLRGAASSRAADRASARRTSWPNRPRCRRRSLRTRRAAGGAEPGGRTSRQPVESSSSLLHLREHDRARRALIAIVPRRPCARSAERPVSGTSFATKAGFVLDPGAAARGWA